MPKPVVATDDAPLLRAASAFDDMVLEELDMRVEEVPKEKRGTAVLLLDPKGLLDWGDAAFPDKSFD